MDGNHQISEQFVRNQQKNSRSTLKFQGMDSINTHEYQSVIMNSSRTNDSAVIRENSVDGIDQTPVENFFIKQQDSNIRNNGLILKPRQTEITSDPNTMPSTTKNGRRGAQDITRGPFSSQSKRMSNFEDSTQESKEGTFATNRLGENYNNGMFSDSHLPH